MPTWAKVILILLALFLIGLAVVGWIGYRFVAGNKERFVAAKKEGVAFGQGKEVGACVDEALRRLGPHGGIGGQVDARLFLNGCLSAASESPTFCETVPKRSEIMASAEWAVQECRRRGAADQQGCSQILQEVVAHCDATRSHPVDNTKTSN